MTRVLAQGVFDIIHPGHIHYLEKSAEKADELVVVIARDSRIARDNFFSEEERKEVVEALECVDEAVLGSEEDIFSTVKELQPDIITLGADQQHNLREIKEKAEEATSKDVEVERVSEKPGYSSSKVRNFYS